MPIHRANEEFKQEQIPCLSIISHCDRYSLQSVFCLFLAAHHRFTRKTITTHKIDPDVDETRDFLIQDLWYSQGLKSFGYVKGVGAAAYSEPRGNLTGDPYFTDGNRAVLWVSSKPIAFSSVGWFEWETPPRDQVD